MQTPSPVSLSFALRVVIGLLLSALSGLAFMLAFPPYEIWPLVFFGWVPMLFAQYRLMPPRLSGLAPALAIGVWLQGYLGPVFTPVGTFMVWLPLIVAGITFLSDGGLRSFHQKTSYRYFLLAGLASWAGGEMIRLFIPIAGTWAFIAYPLFRQTWMLAPVSIFGIIGLGVLILWVNNALALGLLRWADRRWQFDAEGVSVPARPARTALISAGAVCALWLVLSAVLGAARPTATARVTAAAIQPEISPVMTANVDQTEQLKALHESMIAQTRQAAAQGAQFIVWPEGSFLWDPQADDRLNLRALAVETNAHLATGYLVIEEQGFRNEATVINPQGEFLGVFGKDHPVVFGGETSLTRGTYPVYDTPLGKLGTIICYDADYTDTTRKLVRQGAQLIAVPSNDWSTIAATHYAHVVFRAVENNVAMVKADGGYDSAIIAPNGEILALAVKPQGGGATLVAEVPLGDGRGTLTTLLGDWVGWLGLAGMIFFTFFSGWLEKRHAAAQA